MLGTPMGPHLDVWRGQYAAPLPLRAKDEITVGRAKMNTVTLDDLRASGRHLTFWRDGPNAYAMDHSTNGTW